MTALKAKLGLDYSGPGPASFDQALYWAAQDLVRLITDEKNLRAGMGKAYDFEKAKASARLDYLKQLKGFEHEL